MQASSSGETKGLHSCNGKVDGLWYNDGNIIINAGQKSYKIYQGFLSERSRVFRDMFSVPQPSSSTDLDKLPNECQELVLPDDEEDVYSFLRAIFHSSYLQTLPSKELLSSSSILRLSHKYDVPDLRQWAMRRLSVYFPLDLPSYTQLEEWRGPVQIGLSSNKETRNVIALAREVNCLWILPSLYYHATVHEDLEDLLRSKLLSEADKESFACGYTKQRTAIFDLVPFLFRTPTGTCSTTEACIAARAEATKWLITAREEYSAGFPDPLLEFEDNVSWDVFRGMLCHDCAALAEGVYKSTREDFWEKLPSMYNLPGWVELKKMKADATGDGAGASTDDD